MNILVTGANRGLGLALVKEGVKRGHRVIAASRSTSLDLEQLKEKHSDQIITLKMDVGGEESVGQAKETLKSEDLVLHAIINNAGVLYSRDKEVTELDLEEGLKTFEINTFGPIRVVKHFLPLMSDAPILMNISSDAGSITNTYGSDYFYGMSKAALNMFSEKLRLAYKHAAVYSVHPGWMHTDMGGEKAPLDPEQVATDLVDMIEGKKQVASEHSYMDYTGKQLKF
ncbi:SDR family oxidoreductase [Evansella sp. AB-rgal1]|uniref:SDR family oxidoreductase n=1 Tax=Evansella sp. AB-rgal1 TaxID=3242696 RepID=UPI00359E1B65